MELLVHWITEFISQVSYPGIFLLMLVESAGIPAPSEITMPFGGFLVSEGELDFWAVVWAGTLGNLVGSWLAYFLGMWGEGAVVRSSIRKWGRYFLISESELDHAEHWFKRFDQPIVFFSRILPVIRTFISFPAGMARMNFLKFTFYTILGSFIWSYFLAQVGVKFGENWDFLEGYFRQFEYIIAAVFFIAIFWYALRKIKKL